MTRLVIDNCAIATVDADGTEHAHGHIVVRHGFIDAVGAGPAPAPEADEVRIDGRGLLATPGLVNCHHHLYQWATRGLAQQATLFEWLQELYPVWAHVDEEIERAAARAGLAALARSGCTTASDHHYVFPRDGKETCWRSRSRRRATSACASNRAAARWTSAARRAACRRTRSPRPATRSSPPARRRSTASTTRRPRRWCGSPSRPAPRSASPRS